jgi:GNAT superfamily N-acetyltransferase
MIRPATKADIPSMVALFKAQHAAMGCDWSVDEERLCNTFSIAIASPAQWLCLTGDDCLLLAMWFENPLGAGRLAMEFCFCAPPRAMAELISQYEEWARKMGCRAASLSCERRFAAFERLYRKYGYFPAEMTMSKAL